MNSPVRTDLVEADKNSAPNDGFIQEVLKAIRSGREFVPLIGSGFSAGSGILMGQDFTNYLAHAVFFVLDRKWDLRNHGWPAHPTSDEVNKASEWTYREFENCCKELELEPVPGDGPFKIRGVKRKQNEKKGPSAPNNSQPVLGHGAEESESNLLPNFVSSLLHPLIPQILKDSSADESEAATIRLLQSMRMQPLDLISIARPKLSQSSESYIKEAGIRSLHDWRTTLEFLSRIQVDRVGGNRKLRFVKSAQSVIDGFNRFITSNRRPNLGHKMLVHLSEPMRQRIILTTNFDNLLETAFETFSTPIRAIPVSVRGELPAYQTVRAQNCLIKMHGSLLETRADMSLADEPSDDDKQRFAEYMNVCQNLTSPIHQPRPLLVIGFSGSDPRIMSMIKHALDTAPIDQKLVYWVSVSERSDRDARKLFEGYESQVYFVVAPRPDLLLYELYQKVCLCLPQGGLAFEFNHYVPPLRLPKYSCEKELDDIKSSSLNEGMAEINKRFRDEDKRKRLKRDLLVRKVGEFLSEFLDKDPNQRRAQNTKWHLIDQLPSAISLNGQESSQATWFEITAGAVRALRTAFEDFTAKPGTTALWFELQDYVDVESLLRDIVRTIALRRGRMQLQHVMLYPLDAPIAIGRKWKQQRPIFESRLRAQFQAFSFAPRSCLIVLYARDAAGTCAGWTDAAWKSNEFTKLKNLMSSLCALDFRVIYVPLTQKRLERKSEHYKAICLENPDFSEPDWDKYVSEVEKEGFNSHHADSYQTRPTKFEPDNASKDITIANEMLDAAIESFVGNNTNSTKVEFLYALTLFRQSRHPNAMMNEAVYACPQRFNIRGIDNDFLRSSEVNQWLKKLREDRILFYKPGGYLWMHRDMRLGLRRKLERLYLNNGRLLFQRRARMHFLIGDWYFKAFLSSGHVKPVIESIYHRLQAARFARFARPHAKSYQSPAKSIEEEALLQHRKLLFFDALNDVLKLLVLARPNLKIWLASSIGHPLFSGDLNGLRKNLLKWAKFGKDKGEVGVNLEEAVNLDEVCMQLCREFEDLGRSIQAESGVRTDRTLTAIPVTAESGMHQDDKLPDRSIERRTLVKSFNHQWAKVFARVGAEDLFDLISNPPENPRELERELATTKALWIAKYQSDFKRRLMVQYLSEYAYATLRRAKLVFHSSTQTIDFNLWRQMCIACNLGVDYCKHLVRSTVEEQRLRTKLHSIYGLALANLGRFYEAHRHLNEAQAAGSSIAAPMSSVERAIVCLRRAEVYMTECFWIRGFTEICDTDKEELDQIRKARRADGHSWNGSLDRWKYFNPNDLNQVLVESNNDRFMPVSACDWLHPDNDQAAVNLPKGAQAPIYLATLDDAWAELDRAEDFLAGDSQSSLWWGRLATLRLRIYGLLPRNSEQALRSLVFRSQHGFDPIYDWFERGIRATSFDAFRAIRLIDYAIEAINTFENIFQEHSDERDEKRKAMLDSCEKYLSDLQSAVDGLAKAYWSKVANRLKKSIGEHAEQLEVSS